MMSPVAPPAQHLQQLPGRLVVERIRDDAPTDDRSWMVLVRAPEGLTAVRRLDAGEAADDPWVALYSGGSAHALDVPGMLAAVVGPLAAAGVPVFVTSTFDADLVLVPAARLDDAAGALRAAGHTVALDG
jgi:uncharacterized protein